MNKEFFDLQRFAEDGEAPAEPTGGDPNPGGDQAGDGGQPEGHKLPAVDTALGGGTEPAVPESYDFSGSLKEVFGDGATLDDAVSGEFTQLLKGLNATQEQAAAMATFGMKYAQNVGNAIVEAVQNDYVKEVHGWGEAAKQELGGQYQETLAKACTTRNYLEQKVPGFTQMLSLTGAGNHVAMIKALAALSDLVAEDPGHGNGPAGSGGTAQLYDKTNFEKYR